LVEEVKMTKTRVLVIDSSPTDLKFLRDVILRPRGYTVFSAQDGEAGLQAALEHKPDLIIVERRLPKLSGLEVIEALQKKGSDISLILMASESSEQAITRALRLGVQDYIVKPFSGEAMLQTVERVLAEERRRRRRLDKGIAEINKQLERRVKELSTLYRIGKAVTSLLDLEKVLNRIVEAAVFLTGAEEGFLLLVDEETGELYMRAGKGLGEKYAHGFRVRVADSLSGQVVQTGKPIMVSSVQDEEKFKLKTGYLVKSLLHVPLKVRDEIIGVLSVHNRLLPKAFTNNELYLLSALADYTAIAIENARLYWESYEEAKRLTELLHAQQEQARLASEMAERERQEMEGFISGLHSHGEEAALNMEEAEKLARGLRAQATVVEQLAQRLRAQKSRVDQLARTLSASPTLLPFTKELVPLVRGEIVGGQLDPMSAVLGSLAEGVILSESGGRIVIANAAAGRMVGLSGISLVGHDIQTICPDIRWPKNIRLLKLGRTEGPLPEAGKKIEMTMWVGGRMLVATLRRLENETGDMVGMITTLRDVTLEREAQRLGEEFGIAVSQELRTPMTSITGYTDLLLGETVGLIGNMQRKFLQRIKLSTHRMGAVLNELIEVEPVTVERPEVRAKTVDIVQLIDEASSEASTDLQAKGIRLSLEVAENLPPANTDPDSIRQIITNLLSNAHQCTPQNGEISIRARVQQEKPEEPGKNGLTYLVVSVTDSGGGIAPEDQGRVFDRDYRSTHSSITGLGETNTVMPSLKALAESRGGRLWLESEMGVGSTFSLILPVATSSNGDRKGVSGEDSPSL
jgi:signal transduction histidine kinase/GAF domain-containing protein/CheY-like chemotaxis protein